MNLKTKSLELRFPMFKFSSTEHVLIEEGFINVWELVPSVLSVIHIKSEFGLLNIKIDWERALLLIKEDYKKNENNNYTLENYLAGKISEEELKALIIDDDKFISIVFEVEVTDNVNNLEKLDVIENRFINHHVENLLFQIFLTMNLSTPGSFNCFSRELMVDSDFQIYEYSSYPIEFSWGEAIKNGWPNIGSVELSTVWNWIQSLEIGSRQIAQNRTERALFSILHLCRENSITPNKLVWISLALEALYDTPKGQISKVLLERIFLFLGVPEVNKKKFKKKINDFYELRSRFVHGDLDISNPLSNELLDKNCNTYETMILDNCDFGLAIVISTLQKMIQMNLKVLCFKESYYGV